MLSRFTAVAVGAVLFALACQKSPSKPPPPEPTVQEFQDAGSSIEVPDASIAPDGSVIVTNPDASTPGDPDAGVQTPNPIGIENALPGTTAWRISKAAPPGELEGYAKQVSINKGEQLEVAVNAGSAQTTFNWFVYRLGYYGGKGARELAHGGPVTQGPQPACPLSSDTGLVACAWQTSFTVQTTDAWTPGVYLIRLQRADNSERYVPFFVRDDSRAPEILATIPVATWAAYNAWGGESLYQDSRAGLGAPAYKVSLDKPFDGDFGAGQLLTSDRSLVMWLEAQGLDVEYATSMDVDRDPSLLADSATRVVIMSGHDEYWSKNIRDRMEAAVSSGKSLLNFGGNQAFWQVRFESAADGRERRLVTCYKKRAATLDPVGANSPELTAKFRDPPVNRPENALLGVMFNENWHQFAYPLVVRQGQSQHWIFTGTGMQPGDTIPQLAGYEVDEVINNGLTPPGQEIVTDSPILSLYTILGHSQMVLREHNGGLVFSAGGINFVRALASEDTYDARAERIAANVLFRALGRSLPMPRPTFTRTATNQEIKDHWIVSTVGGLAGTPGDVDGAKMLARLQNPVSVAELPDHALVVVDAGANKLKRVETNGAISTLGNRNWLWPSGVAVGADGSIYVAESGTQTIRKVTPGGIVSLLAGQDGIPGNADGALSSASFNTPMGLAISGGDLYVADQGNGSIRKISLSSPNPQVSTVWSNLYRPSAVAVAPDGTLWVVESGMSRVIAIQGGQITQIIGGQPGFGDGNSQAARFLPWLGIAVMPNGSVAVGDGGNYRVRLIKQGSVSTAAGTGRFGFRDGDPADLVLPAGVAVAHDGTLLVADSGNGAIRKLTPAP